MRKLNQVVLHKDKKDNLASNINAHLMTSISPKCGKLWFDYLKEFFIAKDTILCLYISINIKIFSRQKKLDIRTEILNLLANFSN